MTSTFDMLNKEVSLELENYEFLQRGKLIGFDNLHYTVQEGGLNISIPVQKVVKILWDTNDDDEY